MYLSLSTFNFQLSTLSAQDDISKQLEVTRAYTPKVGQAEKLPLEPRMVDTVQLRPQIDYSITPTAWNTAFSSEKYSPASINTTPFELHRPLYVRAGLGIPFQSTADIYYNARANSKSTFGMFANHRGSYSKLENDLGARADATEVSAALGLYGSRRTGAAGRYTLDGGAGYDVRYYQPYGAADMNLAVLSILHPTMPSLKHFAYDHNFDPFYLGKLGGRVGFGDGFADLSRLNFHVGLDAGMSHTSDRGNPATSDFVNSRINQVDVDFRLKLARMWHSKFGFEMELFERGAVDVIDPGVSAVAAVVAPRYVMTLDKLRFKVGLDLRYVFNGMHGQNGVGVSPAAEVSYDIADGGFVPFINYTSHLADGSYEALTRRNPYLGQGGGNHGPTGWVSDLRLGFAGDVNDIFTYRLSGGISLLDNYQIFVARQDIAMDAGEARFSPATFVPEGANGTRVTVGGELGVHNLGGFEARLWADYNNYQFNNRLEMAGDLPKYDVGVEVAYSHKDKFRVRAGVEVIGDRDYYTVYRIGGLEDIRMANSIGAVADVSVSAEAKVARDFWAFIEGRNLANQRLYPYNHYRGQGANVMLGVKVIF